MAEDGQTLWRAVYTTRGGWSSGSALAEHESVAAPVIAGLRGTLLCIHRGARQKGLTAVPLRWTSFTLADTQPYVDQVNRHREGGGTSAGGAASKDRSAACARAGADLERARGWAPDADLPEQLSLDTPALAFHNGVVYCAYSTVHPDEGDVTVAVTRLRDPKAGWQPAGLLRQGDFGGRTTPYGPALVSYGGKLHLLVANLAKAGVTHLVAEPPAGDADIVWRPAFPAASPRGATPFVFTEERHFAWALDGYPASLAATVHDGAVHLVYRGQGDGDSTLSHAVYDGEGWTETVRMGEQYVSRQGAALASYDGVLHVVFPSAESDVLRHGVWDGDTWSFPASLSRHVSNDTPALLVFRDGPARTESLLMVNRGVGTHVPPPPPVSPVIRDIAVAQEHAVSGLSAGFGHDSWSRCRYQVKATAVEFKDGSKGVVGRLTADLAHYRGFGYGPDQGTVRGRLQLYRGRELVRESIVSASAGDNGRAEPTVVWDKLDPGTYEVRVRDGQKVGGFWSGVAGDPGSQAVEHGLWSTIEMSDLSACVTVA